VGDFMTILREYLSIEAIDQIIERLIYLNSVIPNSSPSSPWCKC
jgi:hypothetical protein